MSNECKRCLLRESGENDIITDINERISRINPCERVSEQGYSLRLSECKRCENLLSGVCMKCGCYPELRAAYKNMKCPDTAGDRWTTRAEEQMK